MSRRLRTAAMAGLLSVGVVGGGAAVAATSGPAIHTFTPRSEKQITNIDVLRQQIRNYYGDPMGTGVSSPTSNYAKEARDVARSGVRWLSAQTRAHHRHSGRPAIVLDVDDTTLLTWNYEIASNWAYNPTTNAEYVTNQLFPPVPGMVDLVTWAAKNHIAVFYLTGRPAAQEAATLGNLTSDGVGVVATSGTRIVCQISLSRAWCSGLCLISSARGRSNGIRHSWTIVAGRGLKATTRSAR